MHNYFQQYIKAVEKPLPEMQKYFDVENEYFRSIVSKESTVLDVGCGNGRSIKYISPYVKHVLGIDYDSKMISASLKTTRGCKNCKLLCSDFMEFETSDKFDLVFASYNLLGSAETKPEDRAAILNKMIKLAKPGGHVIASVWSDKGIEFGRKYYPYIGINVLDIKDNGVITNHGTFKRFTKRELNEMGKNVGKTFKIHSFANIFYGLDIVA